LEPLKYFIERCSFLQSFQENKRKERKDYVNFQKLTKGYGGVPAEQRAVPSIYLIP